MTNAPLSLLDRPAVELRSSHWTLVSADAVVVGGTVPTEAWARRVVARAETVTGHDEALGRLHLDPDAPAALGALVFADPVAFEAGSARLGAAATRALGEAADLLWQFDEVFLTALGEGDHEVFEADAVELSRQRVTALTSYLEFRGVAQVDVRVVERTRGLVDARGAARLRPADRRFEIRLRRGI